ncbi:amidohydrolase [uncultured Rhodoblastus sp.]|uniref:amidohydrolase n=1 Tax=uncultured Rhodoblastus sp. TaxID=543037 RepID=UPI0025F12A3B|nr:amidohydrolase [uncultured Rhodoblastus sp.]
MCVGCTPGFRLAFQSLSLPSRRNFLKGSGALAASGVFLAEAVDAARADGEINEILTDGLIGAPTPDAAGPATIFTAQKIITMERAAPEATAIAVAGKRIVAVGSLESVKTALGARPYRIDDTFGAKIVMPGLIDQHLHPILGALTLAVEVIATEDWNLPGRTVKAAATPEEYSQRLKAAEAALKDPDAWLLTWGYHRLWHGKLDRAALDAIGATRPIAVWQRSCHEFYLNTAALKALGISEAMTQGKGIASEQASWKDGHFFETGLNLMMGPMLKVLATPERLSFGLRQMVAYLHANGVTAYNEPGALYTPEMWKLYEQILGAPDAPMYATFLADGRGIPDRVGLARALDATEEQIAVSPEGPGKKLMFFPGQIKLFADGAIISQLMQMKDGYTDGHKGEWIMSPEQLEERARLYWNAGYQLHIHVNGDLGLEVVLDTLERRLKENPRNDHRTVIVHFANSTEEQVARIARLGAIVSANPYYPVGFADKYGSQGLGPARADAMVRANSVVSGNIPLSYHSDLPMGPSDPLYLAWCGVNRITPSGRVAEPGQRVTVDQALRAITIEAAYSWRKEDLIGSLAPGKIANLTVLDRDPYAIEPEKLKDIGVWGTMFEGRVFPVPESAKRKA